MNRMKLTLAMITLCCANYSAAQVFDESFAMWPVDLKVRGTIIALNASSGSAPQEVVDLFVSAAGADAPHAVVLDFTAQPEKSNLRVALEAIDSLDLFGIPSSDGPPAPPGTLTRSLGGATGVWIASDDQLSESQVAVLRSMAESLRKVVQDQGVILASGRAATLLGAVGILGGESHAVLGGGVNLLPDMVVETQFSGDTARQRLLSALASHPRSVGVGLEDNTAIVLSGRKIRALGTGQATFLLMANDQKPLRIKRIRQAEGRPSPYRDLVDLTAWRRDAIDRDSKPFPPAEPEKPIVENGTLFIVGGGGVPEGLMARFVELAGGENAKIVYVPCSESDELSGRQRSSRMFERLGVTSTTVLHTKDRNKANSDDEFLAPLTEATGIWFGGGRQWNFSDSYYGTRAHELMKSVLKRGGVIGGSSAGASIQARYLARANPLGNIDIMAPGYERGGLGFISGVAIDQHFTQRGRHPNMTELVNTYPQLLGIGIDETTALVVQKSIGEVVGRGKVFFYDRTKPVIPGEPDYLGLPDGSKYDLAERLVLEPAPEEDN